MHAERFTILVGLAECAPTAQVLAGKRLPHVYLELCAARRETFVEADGMARINDDVRQLTAAWCHLLPHVGVAHTKRISPFRSSIHLHCILWHPPAASPPELNAELVFAQGEVSILVVFRLLPPRSL